MGNVIWTKAARQSVRVIWEFYAEKSTSAADKIANEIVDAAEHVHFEKQHQTEEILGEPYRRVIVRHFKIVYETRKGTIRVLNVFDSRQDPEKLPTQLPK